MAVVHLGRLRADAGFARYVAIKRLQRQFVGDPELTSLLLDESRLAGRLLHPNVVAPHDLVTSGGEIFMVMEYVHGLTLAVLAQEARARGALVPIPIVTRVLSDLLAGLQAAHGVKDSQGRLLEVVHRDVSPQNVMVGTDGLSRVLDFGIAQAAFRSQTTRDAQIRAKLAYAAPEQILDRPVDFRADVYSAAIVCWELLTLERLFSASNEGARLVRVLERAPQPASRFRSEVPPELDRLLLAALSKDPTKRPDSAEAFAVGLEHVAPPAPHREVARWVASLGGGPLDRLAARLAEVESGGLAGETPTAFTPAVYDTHTNELAWPQGERGHAATGDSASPIKNRWRRAIGAAGLGVTIAAVAIAPALLARRSYGSSVATVAAGSPQVIAALSVAFRVPATALSAPAEHDAPALRGDAIPQRSPAQAAIHAEQKTGTAQAPRPASRPRSSPGATDCAELTEVDAQGIRRVKRQCIR
jgi:serine/threonine-protein kinase